jgi:uncharacterized protein YeaO (DUF488 family)
VALRTRRWNDPAAADDGFRLLVTRYRPRGLPKAGETWSAWWPDLAPSKELLADFKHHGLAWPDYERRYLAEMAAQRETIRRLAAQVSNGEAVTLLCSAACTDPARCHRTLLARLIEDARTVKRRRDHSASQRKPT